MGQKVHPIGFRLGYIKPHQSVWYASKKHYSKHLLEDFKIREFLFKEYEKASVAAVKIERRGDRILVDVLSARPGLLIGKKGEDIEQVKVRISKLTGWNTKVSVTEVKKPDLNAKLVGDGICRQLERRMPFRRTMKRAVQQVMKAGAKGVKILVSGRLGGAEIARPEVQKIGRIPLHTIRADIDFAICEAHTTYGVIGVKVWIYTGDVILGKNKNYQSAESSASQ